MSDLGSVWSDPVVVRLFVCSLTSIGLILSSAEWLVPPGKLAPPSLTVSGRSKITMAERMWSPTGLRILFTARIACATTFLVTAALSSAMLWAGGLALLAAGLLSLPLRYREPVGVFEGMDGAERLMIAAALAAGGSFVFETRLAIEAAIMFVAGQGLLEYAIAGWTKLAAHRAWTSGLSIRRVFSSSHFGHPYLAQLVN